MASIEIQTRSEKNGSRHFASLKEAMEYAEKDEAVWEMSFVLPNKEVIRLHRSTGDDWLFELIAIK